ncbi:kinase-like protein [Gyrodon lividus]|nr:kinase-like protein [Gyrodon lividus]
MRARHARTGQEYAIKILDKNHLIRKEKMLVALAEKNTLVRLGAGHPGIIHLHWTFQDDWSLFFVLDLATNGEMQTRISRMGSLSLACTRYYTAQIVDAIEYMHDKDVIHRDLKPENLLLDSNFRIKITDFGTGKILEGGQERANSFVGTAQYVSPELLERNETSKSSDLWSLGCIVFQMIAGKFAFQGLSDYLTWQKIKSLDYTFPEGFNEDARDFVSKLLVFIAPFFSLPCEQCNELTTSPRIGPRSPRTPRCLWLSIAHLTSPNSPFPRFHKLGNTLDGPSPSARAWAGKERISPRERRRWWTMGHRRGGRSMGGCWCEMGWARRRRR